MVGSRSVSLEFLLQLEGRETSSLALSQGEQAGPLCGVRVGADPWVRQEGWLRWSAHPIGGAVCRLILTTLLLLPTPQ